MGFYITTPLYYVNAEPHLGHAYTTVLADVIARFRRMRGDDVFFLTGTDEHGQKILNAAKKAGCTPLEHCNRYSQRFKKLWEKLGIQYDDFIRTTEQRHEKVVKEILNKLYEKGEIYQGSYSGWYCVPDERFWTEKDIMDGKCPECGRDVVRIEEKNYFFRMSKYQDWLVEYIKSHPDFIAPTSRRNEILGFLKKPLNDLCISRPKERLSWGIPLPFDNDYVTYVWFDALLNYISAPGYLSNEKRFKMWWPADYHLVGKDIITTHAVYWPIMLHAAGIEPPQTIFAHGWWLVEEQKMGKSLGNAISPEGLIERFGRDQFRYFLMRDMVLGQDASFSFERITERINADLANNLGNITSRLLKMIESYLGGAVPRAGAGSPELTKRIETLPDTVFTLIDSMKIDRAIADVNLLLNDVNSLIEQEKPWELAKSTDKRDKLEDVLGTGLLALRMAAYLLYPVMPSKCGEILTALGETVPPQKDDWMQPIKTGKKLLAIEPLFPRIQKKMKNDGKRKDTSSSATARNTTEKEGLLSIDDFFRAQLVVGEITEAEKAPDADRLILLKVYLGKKMGERNLVAGLAKWYSPDELVGKKIIVVANLQPAVIRGHRSEGMLLAADDGKNVVILSPEQNIEPGSKVR